MRKFGKLHCGGEFHAWRKFYVKQNLEGSEDDIEEDLVDPQDKGFKKARFANTVGAMTSGTTLDEEEYNQKKLMCRMGEQEQPWTKHDEAKGGRMGEQ